MGKYGCEIFFFSLCILPFTLVDIASIPFFCPLSCFWQAFVPLNDPLMRAACLLFMTPHLDYEYAHMRRCRDGHHGQFNHTVLRSLLSRAILFSSLLFLLGSLPIFGSLSSRVYVPPFLPLAISFACLALSFVALSCSRIYQSTVRSRSISLHFRPSLPACHVSFVNILAS